MFLDLEDLNHEIFAWVEPGVWYLVGSSFMLQVNGGHKTDSAKLCSFGLMVMEMQRRKGITMGEGSL